MNSPTQRSLALLREAGYRCAIVEKWIPQTKRRNDLFGFVDLLAIRDNETLAVQTTSGSNVASRITKITEDCADALADVRAAGWRIEVHGWRKVKRNGRLVWDARVVDIS